MDKTKPAKTQLSYLIPAFRVIQDLSTRNWTVADIFDLLIIPKELESTIVSFQVFGRLEDVPSGNNTTVIRILHSDGSELATQTLNGELVQGFVKFKAEFNFVKLEKEGRYHFELTQNAKKLTGGNKFYFTVVKQK